MKSLRWGWGVRVGLTGPTIFHVYKNFRRYRSYSHLQIRFQNVRKIPIRKEAYETSNITNNDEMEIAFDIGLFVNLFYREI